MAIYSGFSHEKWWFSIVMLVYRRVFGVSPPKMNRLEKRKTMNFNERWSESDNLSELGALSQSWGNKWKRNLQSASTERHKPWVFLSGIISQVLLKNGLSLGLLMIVCRAWKSASLIHTSIAGYHINIYQPLLRCKNWFVKTSCLVLQSPDLLVS